MVGESAFHPEDRARSLIDRRLVVCGWLIQSKSEMNLGAGLGVAVREFQPESGPVDYWAQALRCNRGETGRHHASAIVAKALGEGLE